MLIRCPKCRSVYDLPDNLMPAEGLKMRCAECGEIWVGRKRDALKVPQKDLKNIQQMFDSISESEESLFHDEPHVQVVKVLQVKHTFNWILLTIALFFLAFWLFAARYEIVRLMPGAERFYTALSIESVPIGQNLELRNITTREFTEHNLPKLEISGKIVNTGSSLTLVPPVKIEVAEKDGETLIQTFYQPAINRLEGGYDMLFYVVLDNPSSKKKSVYLTFYDRLSGEK